MKLSELDPHLLKILSSDTYRYEGVSWEEADGVEFDCPTCYVKNGNTGVGTHKVICWFPHVGQEHFPKPGRWSKQGSSLADLTLGPPNAHSSNSVALQGGCNAHFFVRSGEIVPA